jgi:hypothetical protein
MVHYRAQKILLLDIILSQTSPFFYLSPALSSWRLPFGNALKSGPHISSFSEPLISDLHELDLQFHDENVYVARAEKRGRREGEISVHSSEQPIAFMSVMLCLSACCSFYFALLTNRPCRAVTWACIAFPVCLSLSLSLLTGKLQWTIADPFRYLSANGKMVAVCSQPEA